jgi:hypothetical protein
MTTENTQTEAAAGTEKAGTEGENKPPETVAYAEFEKLDQRSKRMESLAKDHEVKLKEALAKLEKFSGIDLEEVKRVREDKEKLEAEARKNNPEELERHYQRKLQNREKELGDKLTDSEKQLAEKETIIKGLRVTNVVMAKIAHRFNADVQEDVQARISRDGDYQDDQIVFKDPDGTILMSKKSRGEYMTPEEYGEHLAAAKPSWAKTEATGGSKSAGTKTVAQSGATTLPPNWNSFTKEQQTQFFKDNPKALANFVSTAG